MASRKKKVATTRPIKQVPEDAPLVAAVHDPAHGEDESCPWLAQCQALQQANQELSRLKSLTEAIVDSIPAGLATWDEDLRLTYANAGFHEMFDCSLGCLGRRLEEFFTDERSEEWAASMRQVLASGEPVVEPSFPHPVSDEPDAALRAHLTRVNGSNGEGDAGPQVLMALEDVSDRERLHHQLVVSEKLAAMGLLSAGVAHELRTPLSVIRLAAFDVKDMLDDAVPDASEQMDLIEKNVLQCNHIVESLLNFARESPHEARELDLNQLIRDCLDLARRQIAVQDIVVERQFAKLPPVCAPEDDLKQVVSNIILNAVQAMPEGGYLTITSRQLDDDTVRVEVADTGEGVSKENAERIFDPFFTTKDPGEGTGLGLSICRKIINKLGGAISVESASGEGTTFRVDFPLDTSGTGDVTSDE